MTDIYGPDHRLTQHERLGANAWVVTCACGWAGVDETYKKLRLRSLTHMELAKVMTGKSPDTEADSWDG